MSRSKRGKKAANRKKYMHKDKSDKFFVASESEAGTASDREDPVIDNADKPVNRAVGGVTGIKPGVSAPPNEGVVNGDCGLDGHKLKADTITKNEASYAEITGGFSVGAGSKCGSALNQGFVDGVKGADGARLKRVGESSNADSNQLFDQVGPRGKAGDRDDKKRTKRKHVRPNAVLTEEEETFITAANLPIYLMPAIREIIQSRRNYEFLRSSNGSGKARILFEEALAKHNLAHAPDYVDPRLFPRMNDNSEGIPSKRPDPAKVDDLRLAPF
ncbi:hypothetical protein C7212DRAFT_362657 [Tuber magnatum]|uniref:Uncharacterized protein n=1 Tax=Tuber magnatum TaxID=42249 RepID=A0A317SSW1_9PEZI|nr:hypothetical protein C7212DRAFT_362657 [Tuber magnatum]